MQLRLTAALRDIQHAGNLVVGMSFKAVQHEHGSRPVWQLSNGMLETHLAIHIIWHGFFFGIVNI